MFLHVTFEGHRNKMSNTFFPVFVTGSRARRHCRPAGWYGRCLPYLVRSSRSIVARLSWPEAGQLDLLHAGICDWTIKKQTTKSKEEAMRKDITSLCEICKKDDEGKDNRRWITSRIVCDEFPSLVWTTIHIPHCDYIRLFANPVTLE